MRRAKIAVFRHGHLERFSRDLNEDSAVVRLRVDGEFFFTDLRQFTGHQGLSGLFEKLEAQGAGQELFLGGHRLDDGSFWLHWLIIPGKLELMPAQPDDSARASRSRLIVWTFFTVLFVLAGAGILFSGTHNSLALAAATLLFCGGVAGCGWGALKAAVELAHSGSAIAVEMYRGWTSCLSSLAEGRVWQTPGLGPAEVFTPPPLPAKRPRGTTRVHLDGAWSSDSASIMPTGYSAGTIHFVVYNFVHQGQTFSWVAGSLTAIEETKPPSCRNGHPTFLAQGDEVLIFSSDRPTGNRADFINTLAVPLEGRPIIELFNLTDQSAYTSAITCKKNPAMWYVLTGMVNAFLFPGLLAMGILMSSGLLELLRLLAFFIPTMLLVSGLMILVGELVSVAVYDAETAAGQDSWQEFVAPLKRTPKDSLSFSHSAPTLWGWFLPRRFRILAAVMAVSALCLLPWFLFS